MTSLHIFFRGLHVSTPNFRLPRTVKVEYPDTDRFTMSGFEAVCDFERLNELDCVGKPNFNWVQVGAATEVADWDLYGAGKANIRILPDKVRWLALFPVCRQYGRYYPALQEITPETDGEDFYFFADGQPAGQPIQAALELNYLNRLPIPGPDAKLAVIKATDWKLHPERETATIHPRDICAVEILSRSAVRVF